MINPHILKLARASCDQCAKKDICSLEHWIQSKIISDDVFLWRLIDQLFADEKTQKDLFNRISAYGRDGSIFRRIENINWLINILKSNNLLYQQIINQSSAEGVIKQAPPAPVAVTTAVIAPPVAIAPIPKLNLSQIISPAMTTPICPAVEIIAPPPPIETPKETSISTQDSIENDFVNIKHLNTDDSDNQKRVTRKRSKIIDGYGV